MSIGEVLEALRGDFEDVSISKIRFLESEGLISPERTESGYRKFYDSDLQRLRHILTLQRDHFMPLKVIKERLEGSDPSEVSQVLPDQGPAPPPAPAAAGNGDLAADATGLQLDRGELLSTSGLREEDLVGLEDFGLIRSSGPYDENDLLIAGAARRFLDYGIEPRHLRMYRQFVDREAAVFEQIVSPVARKQDPKAQGQVSRSVKELVGLSRQMHEGALRSSLREML
jgi:DNA-binding transcriptional MerR regulator